MIERCRKVTRRGTRCLNSSRINGLCLIHYNSKIHKPRYLKKLKVEKYYSGKLNGFWEISEKILFFVSILVIFTGIYLGTLSIACNITCKGYEDCSGCENIWMAMIITWIIVIISYTLFNFAVEKKEETRWRENDRRI
jgi:hypothetical protein